ncbi:MAG: CapA family protein [Treponema sp.]|jgi:poly-gamma-glutamate synthesis protein (capsule biosynthesis protein)|nr:CapA family protein [Treponema sp.]
MRFSSAFKPGVRTLGLLCLLLASCGPGTVPEPEPPEPPRPGELTIVAAGDNLFHETITAAFREEGGWDFAPIYDLIKPVISGADLAFINQETALGRESFGYSGYPRFNTPQALAFNLAAAGFDIINQANNHIMDKGEAGVMDTIAAWDRVRGTAYLGIHRSREERDRRRVIIEKNGLRAGFLAYTYGTNGLAVPGDKPYLVSLIDEETIIRETGALRPLCDVLVVSMHWGDEYGPAPSAGQTALAALLAAQKVDLVIGHHPHVLQPAEYILRPDGRQMLCFYSLGNFMSSQRQPAALVGGLMYVKLTGPAGNIMFADAGIIPVITHYESGWTGYRVYPLYRYTAGLVQKHRSYHAKTGLNMEYINAVLDSLKVKLIMQNPFAPAGAAPPDPH